ncbi:MAG TPA: hypothetical protein VFN75_03495 [Pseudonocardiaceae bacterium]|nr:hypothetical protein [Pseudonocardiaceae bacterium]
MTVSLIILVVTLLVGVLIGHTSAERLLEVRTKRQAAAQRSLNSQRRALAIEWQELAAAQREIAEQQEAELRRPTRY